MVACGPCSEQFQLIASGLANDFAASCEFGQDGADGSGANAAQLLQLVNGDRVDTVDVSKRRLIPLPDISIYFASLSNPLRNSRPAK